MMGNIELAKNYNASSYRHACHEAESMSFCDHCHFKMILLVEELLGAQKLRHVYWSAENWEYQVTRAAEE